MDEQDIEILGFTTMSFYGIYSITTTPRLLQSGCRQDPEVAGLRLTSGIGISQHSGEQLSNLWGIFIRNQTGNSPVWDFGNSSEIWDHFPLKLSLPWCHNEHDGISNHQPHDCLLNRLFRCRSKKTSKLRVTCLCAGNSLVTGEFRAQMTSNAENVSIWWRHHVNPFFSEIC